MFGGWLQYMRGGFAHFGKNKRGSESCSHSDLKDRLKAVKKALFACLGKSSCLHCLSFVKTVVMMPQGCNWMVMRTVSLILCG